MATLLEQLAAIARENLLGEKIVIAPSLAIGHQIGDALAQSGTAWVNLRFESVRTLVDAVGGFDLANEELTVLSRAQALALIEKACDRALQEDSYFASLADRPGLHRAIQRSIEDLRLAGVAVANVARSAFEVPRKADDLLKSVAAYDEELSRGRFIDRAGVLARAITKLAGSTERPWPDDAAWILIGHLDLSSEEERFLELASRGKLMRVAQPSTQLSFGANAEVKFVRAVGEENELRAAFRAILATQGQFDSAELIYTTQEIYLPMAYELAAEYEVPCTFAQGIAASYTRPGQAALAFLHWIGDGWDASVLQHAIRSGSVNLPKAEEEDELARLTPSSFARILRDSRIGWGRDRYLTRLDAWIAEKQRSAADADDKRKAAREREVKRGQAAKAVVQEFLAITGEIEDGDEIDMTALARAAGRFVTKLAAVRSEVDGMARSGLERMFEELASLPSSRVARADATERLRDAVSALHVSASNPRPGHLHVAPIRAGGWSGRPLAFLVGLDDAKYPGAGLQDPIVLDSERAEINRAIEPRRLPLRGEAPVRMSEEFRQLTQRLQHCRRITLSWPGMNLSERRELYPSGAVLDVFRAAEKREDATYEDVLAAVQPPSGFVDVSAPLNGGEWWLGHTLSSRRPAAESAVRRAYAALGNGAQALAARASEQITRWDGLIQAPAQELDPRLNGRIYSASRLESMARCPIGYFFEHHLGIEPLEELSRNPDQWLEPMEYGNLFHEVLQRFMDEVCRSGARPARKKHGDRLHAIAEEVLRRWRDLVPPPNETAFERRREDLLRSCDVFLRVEEMDCSKVTPKYFEVSFGAGDDDQGTHSFSTSARGDRSGFAVALIGSISMRPPEDGMYGTTSPAGPMDIATDSSSAARAFNTPSTAAPSAPCWSARESRQLSAAPGTTFQR